MTDEEKLEVEINLLLTFEYVPAWSGSLDNLSQKSYVLYSDIIHALNKKRDELKILRDEKRGKTTIF